MNPVQVTKLDDDTEANLNDHDYDHWQMPVHHTCIMRRMHHDVHKVTVFYINLQNIQSPWIVLVSIPSR